MIKLVAIDIDDTLLNSQHQISKENYGRSIVQKPVLKVLLLY